MNLRSTFGSTSIAIVALGLAACTGMPTPGSVASAGETAAPAVKDELIVVASPAAQEGAGELLEFLTRKEKAYRLVDPTAAPTLDLNTTAAILIVGTSEDGAAKDAARSVLSAEEFAWISEAGNNSIYSKTMGEEGSQYVMVIGGSHPAVATDGLEYYRNQWITELATALDISLTSRELYSY